MYAQQELNHVKLPSFFPFKDVFKVLLTEEQKTKKDIPLSPRKPHVKPQTSGREVFHKLIHLKQHAKEIISQNPMTQVRRNIQ